MTMPGNADCISEILGDKIEMLEVHVFIQPEHMHNNKQFSGFCIPPKFTKA